MTGVMNYKNKLDKLFVNPYVDFACIVTSLKLRKRIYDAYDTCYKYEIIQRTQEILQHAPNFFDRIKPDVQRAFVFSYVHSKCCNKPDPNCKLRGGFDNAVYSAVCVCKQQGTSQMESELDILKEKMEREHLDADLIFYYMDTMDDLDDEIDKSMARLIMNKLPLAICKQMLGFALDSLETIVTDEETEIYHHDIAKKIRRYFLAVLNTVGNPDMCRECGKVNGSKRKSFRCCKQCKRVFFCSAQCHKTSITSNVHGHVVECGLLSLTQNQ